MVLHPGRPELPLDIRLLEHHRRTSSMLTRSMTTLVPSPQRGRLQLAAVCRQHQRQLVRVDLSIHSNRRTTASRHMLGARKEKEALRKEAREVCSLAGNLQE